MSFIITEEFTKSEIINNNIQSILEILSKDELDIVYFKDFYSILYRKFKDHLFTKNPYIILLILSKGTKKKFKSYIHFYLETIESKYFINVVKRCQSLINYFKNKKYNVVYSYIIFANCSHNLPKINFKNINYKKINEKFIAVGKINFYKYLYYILNYYKENKKFPFKYIRGITDSFEILPLGSNFLKIPYYSELFNELLNKQYYLIFNEIFYKYWKIYTFMYIFIDKNKIENKKFKELYIYKDEFLKININKKFTTDLYFFLKRSKNYNFSDNPELNNLFKKFIYLLNSNIDFFMFSKLIEALDINYKKNNKKISLKEIINNFYNLRCKLDIKENYERNLSEIIENIEDNEEISKFELYSSFYNFFKLEIRAIKNRKRLVNDLLKFRKEYIINYFHDLFNKRIKKKHIKKMVEERFKEILENWNITKKIRYKKILKLFFKEIEKIYGKNILMDIFEIYNKNSLLGLDLFFKIISSIYNDIFNNLTYKVKVNTKRADLEFKKLVKSLDSKKTLEVNSLQFIKKYPKESRYLIPGIFFIRVSELKKLENIINERDIKKDFIKTLSRFRFTNMFHDLIFFIDDIESFKKIFYLYKQLSPKSNQLSIELLAIHKIYNILKNNKKYQDKIDLILKDVKNVSKLPNIIHKIESIILENEFKDYEKKYKGKFKDEIEKYFTKFILSLIRNKNNKIIKENIHLFDKIPQKFLFYDREYNEEFNEIGKVKIHFKNFDSILSIIAPEEVKCCADITNYKFWDYFSHEYTYNLIIENGNILLWSLLVWAKDLEGNIYLVLDNIEVKDNQTIRKILTKEFYKISNVIFKYLENIENENVIKDEFFIGLFYNDLDIDKFANTVNLMISPLKKLYYTDAFNNSFIYNIKK